MQKGIFTTRKRTTAIEIALVWLAPLIRRDMHADEIKGQAVVVAAGKTAGRQSATQTVSELWAAALAATTYDDLAPDVVNKVVLTLADCVGVLTYNAGRKEVRRFHSMTATGGRAEARELVTGWRVPLAEAAAINAFAIHGHEIDDTNLRNQLRASCVAVPAPLATAEYMRASGKDLVLALAISYQVSDRLATLMNIQPRGRLHAKGLMPSSVCGVVGAAAASGRLLTLDQRRSVSAMGLAAAGANGLFQYYLEGTDEKKIHVTRSQRMAIESALLARRGFR